MEPARKPEPDVRISSPEAPRQTPMPPATRPPHRDAILAAFRAAIDAAGPATSFDRYCRVEENAIVFASGASLDLRDVRRIWLVGAGKASGGLAAAARRRLGDRVAGGAIAIRAGDEQPSIPGVTIHHAGHPVPDDTSVAAADDALRIARTADPRDLILCLLSGGASSLWAAPPDGVTLGELRALTSALLRSGAPIAEMNAVRSQLSRIAGGRLVAAARAPVVTLAISDVIAAPVEVIGSGPTLPSTSTPADALRVIHGRGIDAAESIRTHLRKHAGQSPEPRLATPGDPAPPDVSFHVIASIGEALTAAGSSLGADGYRVFTVDRAIQGEARDVSAAAVEAALAVRARGGAGVALIWGGETTVTVTGDGLGGRNQELALSAALHLVGHGGITFASLATDGSDGPTRAAGAIVDSGTVARAAKRGLDSAAALRDNDSHALLEAAAALVRTGPTGTNVNDLIFALID